MATNSSTLRRVFGSVPLPMLARLEASLPRGSEWRYEPKFDGFRGLLWRAPGGTVHLLSRNLKDLGASFPELVHAGDALPPSTLVDGEIVIADGDGRSDFGALQVRLGMRKRDARRAVSGRQAVLLVFDVICHDGADLTDTRLCDRRARLEALLKRHNPCLQLIVQTAAVEEAEDWLKLVPGIEGVVAKRNDSRYLPGQRGWIKVKKHRTADCVVIGVAGDMSRPTLVLGLRHTDGNVHHFGLARFGRHMLTSTLADMLAQAGPQQTPIASRWQHAAVPAWRPVPPTLVCEVAYTVLDADRWLRSPARFVRWRPDRSPEDCLLEQLADA